MAERWVLVTGGAHRLGRETCLAFARAGWQLLCHYQRSHAAALDTCAEVQALGQRAQALQAELADDAARESLLQQAWQISGGRLGAVVNNASSFEPDTGLDFSPALLRQQLEVNLLAPLHLGRLLAQHAQRSAGDTAPALIHVLDQKVHNLNPDYFSYTVSKLALERCVALQAQALAPHVRVSGLVPGLMYPSGPQSAANFERASRVNLLRSAIDPRDVARSAVFLAENASITGVCLGVNKGQHLLPLERDVMFVVDQLAHSSQGAA